MGGERLFFSILKLLYWLSRLIIFSWSIKIKDVRKTARLPVAVRLIKLVLHFSVGFCECPEYSQWQKTFAFSFIKHLSFRTFAIPLSFPVIRIFSTYLLGILGDLIAHWRQENANGTHTHGSGTRRPRPAEVSSLSWVSGESLFSPAGA